jgi:hypothetical protein
MTGLLPVATVLLVLSLSLLIVRIGTVALTYTGLSKDLAHFQALSAFTGSGFTTKESEEIVSHPVRRRIVMHLMLLGNAGIVIAISSVVLSFLNTPEQDDWYEAAWFRLTVLSGGVFLLVLLASSRYVDLLLWRFNTWALRRWASIDIRDYTKLLRFRHNYVVCELQVHEDDWLAGRTLLELQLASEGVLVLGIERHDGTYFGAPRGTSRVEQGDTLILYGRQETLLDLDERRAGIVGNLHHVMAVTRQLDVIQKEEE